LLAYLCRNRLAFNIVATICNWYKIARRRHD
jgi:hypothetical protein